MDDKTQASQEFSIDQLHSFLEQARTAGKDVGADKVKVNKWESKYDKDKRTLQTGALVDPLDGDHRVSMLIVAITAADAKTIYVATSCMPEVKSHPLGAGGSGIVGSAMTTLFDPATHGGDVVAFIGGMVAKKDGGTEQFFFQKKVKVGISPN